MSSFFRRPGESSSGDSSGDSSDGEEAAGLEASKQSNGSEDGVELATAEPLSTNASFSKGEEQDQSAQPSLPNAQHHRDMMFATLLEEWCKTRAAELMNNALGDDNNNRFHRLSPEVQDLAQKLYSDAGQTLSSTGFLPTAVTSQDRRPARQQYLAGLDGISLRALEEKDLKPTAGVKKLSEGSASNTLAVVRAERRRSSILNIIQEPINSIIMQTGRLNISSPGSDMQLTYSRGHQSHYESSFQQMRLLGKGGFGRVYHAFNVFDRKEYAVKKIPLSHKLSQRYRESGHQELESVLREVQALAELEHSNIVRYHATWIEEPKTTIVSPPVSQPRRTHPIPIVRESTQKLLDIRPYQSPPNDRLMVSPRAKSRDYSDGIVFGQDDNSRRNSQEIFANGWSRSFHHRDSSPVRESEIFTDGPNHPRTGSNDASVDSAVYVLHVQMSMYPMTLTQYLSPSPSTSSTNSPGSPLRRHCFHLVPTLKIVLGILCGLQYIHAKGLIHRDIKPGNIFLSSFSNTDLISDGFYDVGSCTSCPDSPSLHLNPRIGDFGLVAELARSSAADSLHAPSSSESKPVVGTEYYRPPAWPDDKGKGRTAHAIDEKLDVFALGVILVEMLWACGTSSERMHVLKDLQRAKLPKGLAERIDKEEAAEGCGKQVMGETVEECIRGMIERDPERRWGCQRVRECVEGILEQCRTKEDTDADADVDKKKAQTLNGT